MRSRGGHHNSWGLDAALFRRQHEKVKKRTEMEGLDEHKEWGGMKMDDKFEICGANLPGRVGTGVGEREVITEGQNGMEIDRTACKKGRNEVCWKGRGKHSTSKRRW